MRRVLRNSRFYAGITLLGIAVLIGVATSRSYAEPPAFEPPREYQILVHALGPWFGDFGFDAEGRGGIAAAHSYSRLMARRIREEHGRLLLLQGGDLTGVGREATNTGDESRLDARRLEEYGREFIEKLVYPELQLIRYMRYDALALSPLENRLLLAAGRHPTLRHAPALSFDIQTQLYQKDAEPLRPFRIYQAEDYNILITALNRGPNPYYSPLPHVQRLLREKLNNKSLDLIVVLKPYRPLDTSENAPPCDRDETACLMEIEQVLNPFRTLDSPRPAVLLVRYGAPHNLYHKLVTNDYICDVKARTLCEARFRFRNHSLTSHTQRFIDFNTKTQPAAWIAPDRLLLDTFRRAEERALERAKHPRPTDSAPLVDPEQERRGPTLPKKTALR